MIPFTYRRADAPSDAIKTLTSDNAKFLGGGTNLVDLMRYGVENPTALVDINHVGLDQVQADAGGAKIGALVRNSDLANHPGILANYPLLSHALLSGASAQLRNRATTGGNLLQRTRCYYFMDTAFPACNKRAPGSGCAAVNGYNRIHAILGQSDEGASSAHTCIATNPSDMNVALYALNATVDVLGPKGKRSVPVRDFHRLPEGKPEKDTNLDPKELILGVSLPGSRFAKNSWYLKARDRQSYAFALVSVAVGLEMDGDVIRSAGLALGGVAHKPWYSAQAEHELVSKPATPETFQKAASAALAGAKGYEHNTFKIELAKQCIVRALTLASKGGASMMQSDAKPQQPPQTPHRYDGIAKVTGKAKYAAEFSEPFPKSQLVYAYMVQATVPAGTVKTMDISRAERASGVLAVLTPFNTPKLSVGSPQPPAKRSLTVLQNADVAYNGQPIGLVVAKTLPEAKYAAKLIQITYAEQPAKLDFMGRLGEARPPKNVGKEPAKQSRMDLDQAFRQSTVSIENTYVTPIQVHNPMEPHATIAWWDGEKLNVYDATQYITGDRMSLARTLNIALDNVRVQSPYVGGGFGSKGSTWSHVILAAMSAKIVGKPVKLVLDREQMFGPVGYRPSTVNKIRLAADAGGKLTLVQQDVIMNASVLEDFAEHSEGPARKLYASKTIATSINMVDVNYAVGTFMRAPGESSGTAVLEIAMDELAEKLKMDPIQLRLVNYAERDPSEDKPWSSKHLRECYQQAAERFGWSKRSPIPRQTSEGNNFIGYGMATATYPANRSAAQAVARYLPSGRVFVGSGTQDIGTGMYTVMAQTAAANLGIDPMQVEVKLGDSLLPKAPVSGGSQSTASVGPAVDAACSQLKLKVAALAITDPKSALHGAQDTDVDVKNGKVFSKSDPSKSESVAALITRNGSKPVEAQGGAEPGEDKGSTTQQSFGAVFAEVAVDKSTHMVQVRRMVATYDIGTLVNDVTGMNQLEGGITWGVSFALHEEGVIDKTYGRTVNENLAEYHVPVNADIGTMDVTVLNIPDTKFNPLGARGIGEIGITGAMAAVANAIYNATGKRVRHYPITADKIMLA